MKLLHSSDVNNSTVFVSTSFYDIKDYFNKKQAYFSSLGGLRLSPLGTSATVGPLYQPRIIDDDDYGAVGGMRIVR
jgi:hypothetical protein